MKYSNWGGVVVAILSQLGAYSFSGTWVEFFCDCILVIFLIGGFMSFGPLSRAKYIFKASDQNFFDYYSMSSKELCIHNFLLSGFLTTVIGLIVSFVF